MSIENPGTSSGATSTDVEQRATQDYSKATETVRHDLDAVQQKAAEDAKALKREAENQLGAAAEKAKSFAAEQKDFAATQISSIATAISKVADELEGDQATTARYARDLANGLERFGRNVQGKSVDDLMSMAQQFGRSQPLAFLGAAALAGFVASRFAGASAHRAAQANAQSQTAMSGMSQDDGYGESYSEPTGSGYGRTGNGTGYQSSSTLTGGGNVTGS